MRARLAQDPEAESLAPLLNPVLLLELPETERTLHLRDQARADTTLSLMARLLGEAGPAVLLLEDGHWLDSSSWELLRRVARDVPGWLVVLSTRPLLDSPPPALEYLSRLPSTRRVVLSPMKGEDILALVCARLGVTRLPGAVAAFIQAKAEGHPFYSEELAYTLRDNGLLLVEHGECRLAPEAGNLEALGLPSTLEGLITSRIDRLTTVQQLTLKAASVIGRTFGSRLLGDVHPLPEERERLEEHLSRLQAQDLALPVGAPSESSYLFKHVITQEVAYNLLLFSQRRRLHEAVARWYERTHERELTPLYPLLAYHWIRANERTKALEALEKAGEHALATHAPREAVGFFSKALELEAEGPERVEPSRRARWERRLGRALRWLGKPEARWHLSRAMELLGHPVPQGRGALALGTLLGAARHFLGWVPGLRRPGRGARTPGRGWRRRRRARIWRRSRTTSWKCRGSATSCSRWPTSPIAPASRASGRGPTRR
ncbi:ATP-binding protein [Cystobacter fuscus]